MKKILPNIELKDPTKSETSGETIYSAATAAATVGCAAGRVVAGECKNYEDRNDDPDKALVIVEKSAKAVVIHGIPPKIF